MKPPTAALPAIGPMSVRESADQTRKYAIRMRITAMVITDTFTSVMKLR
jgi:hypothetical protein